jgi:SWIM zinc finger
LALTSESVAALANAGLVKRAERELAAGKRPQLVEDAAGVVTGTFEDGVVTRLLPGTSLRDTPCSCGAQTVCRHRVAVALAYRAWASVQVEEGGASADAAPAASAEAAGSPGDVADDVLLARIGKRAFERALSLRRTGVVVEVRRPGPLDAVPSARLPACTVRFLVGRDLAYAQCDCTLKHDCEHVAVAVWAFRVAAAAADSPPQQLVEVGEPRGSSEPDAALTASIELAAHLLNEGAAHAPESLAQRFALVTERLTAAGHTWPATVVADLEDQLAAYHARSSRYRAARFCELLAELVARPRAASRGGALPARIILGQDEAMEARLDHVRLVSLGARVLADGRDREVELLLADPDTATVLSLRKRWSFGQGEEPLDAPALGRRRIASSVTLAALAKGQIVTRSARRRADRSVAFGESRGGLSSVTPQAGDFQILPPPIRVARLADLEATFRTRGPQLLRPRVLAEDVHVVEVADVLSVAFLPGAQRLVATLVDAEGAALRLVRPYRAVTPHAIDHLAAALSGRFGKVRFVSGEVTRRLGHFELEPLAVVCDRLVVPDVEPEPAEQPADPHPLARSLELPGADPLAAALDEALGALEAGAHHGLQHGAHGYPDQLRAAAEHLDRIGLVDCAAALTAVATELRGARATSSDAGWQATVDAWMNAAIRLHIAKEQL